jgi:hypothetical protein
MYKFEKFTINQTKKNKKVNWTTIGRLNIEKIIKDNDIDTLESILF